MLSLQTVSRTSLNIRPINWTGLSKRYMHPGELEVLIALVRTTAARVMIEFGVNEGRTAKAVIRECTTIEQYWGIDVDLGYIPSKKVQRLEVPVEPGKFVVGEPLFNLVLKPRGSLDLGADDLPWCDVAFIDGDHGREAVEHDTGLAQHLVVSGGLIIWHDYHDLGTVDVKDVLEEKASQGQQIKHVEGTWLAFQRR